MKSVARTNFLCVTFNPMPIRVVKKTSTPRSLEVPFASAITVQLYSTLKRLYPTFVQMMVITIINIFRVFQDSPHKINWSFKINLKNYFIPLRPKKPTHCHEDCLPTIIWSSTPMLDKVAENTLPTIRRKKASYVIRRNKYEPHISSLHTVTQYMKGIFIIPPQLEREGEISIPHLLLQKLVRIH